MSAETQVKQTVELFISYSHVDERFRQELEKHLSALESNGLLVSWNFRKISPGKEWSKEIDSHLKTAQIILLLISNNYLKSDYCNGVEVTRAMKRHKNGEARVIPVILKPLRAEDWQDTPYSKLQALPEHAKPITQWPNQKKAFENIIKGILKVINELKFKKPKRFKGKNKIKKISKTIKLLKRKSPIIKPSKIIIIEDDAKWLQRIGEMLRAQDFKTEAYNRYSDKLLHRLSQNDYDLLIIDLILDTLGLTKQGKKLAQLARDSNKNLPIIVVSGFGDMYDVKEAYSDLKIHDFIFKHEWDPASFLTAVKSALVNKQSKNGDSR